MVIETVSLKIYIRHVLKTIKKVTLQWHICFKTFQTQTKLSCNCTRIEDTDL